MMEEVMPRILAVDDDEGTLALYRLGLKEKGFEVYTASDETMAIEEIEEEIPDAIIVDMWMPQDGSVSLLKWLRVHDDTKAIPVVAVSAKDADDAWDEDDLRWMSFLTKPVDIDELADVLQELINQDE
jgi:DNA-binding response OmpR family regulator